MAAIRIVTVKLPTLTRQVKPKYAISMEMNANPGQMPLLGITYTLKVPSIIKIIYIQNITIYVLRMVLRCLIFSLKMIQVAIFWETKGKAFALEERKLRQVISAEQLAKLLAYHLLGMGLRE